MTDPYRTNFAKDRRWEKIQMFYTLKCDEATPGDPYPCGEWDVTTHTYVRQHTGRYDSTLQTHPSFIVEGESPEQFVYSNSPRYHYFSYWQDSERHEWNDHEMQILKFQTFLVDGPVLLEHVPYPIW